MGCRPQPGRGVASDPQTDVRLCVRGCDHPRTHRGVVTKTQWTKWFVPVAAVAALRSYKGTREPRVPDDAVVSCRYGREAVAWAVTEGSTGLQYYFSDGGETVELGWGYDGEPACVVGKNRGRYLVSWGWADSYGGTPELRVAIVERGIVVGARKVASGGWEVHPVAVRPLRDGGWRLWYQDRQDDPVYSVRLNRNGE